LPVTWSRDGKDILVFIRGNKNEAGKSPNQKIALVSVSNGAIRDLKEIEKLDFGGHIDMSPNGNYIVYTLDQNEDTAAKDIYLFSMDGSVDMKIVGDMANDTDPKWSPDGKEILFLSDRYGSNDLWRLKIESGKPIGVAEIVKPNLGDRIWLHRFTNDGALHYRSSNIRSDIYTVNLDENSGNDYMKPHKISILQEKMNRQPMWSSDGRYVVYHRWHKFRHDILGEQYHITIYDTKTGAVQNLTTNIYGGQNLGSPAWTQNGEKLLFHGTINEDLQFGYFSFDIKSMKTAPIQTKKNTSRNEFGGRFNTNHTFSNDDKSIFMLSNDQRKIIKIDIKTKKETTIFTGEDEISRFKLSNDNSKIAYKYSSVDRNDLYIVSSTGGESKKILSPVKGTFPRGFYWDKNDEFLYFTEGNYGDLKKIMRISVDGGNPELFVNLSDAFSSGRVWIAKIDPDGKRLVVQLNVGKGQEVWKLEGIFDD
jgi:Tol biopolymer transport system component